MSAKMLVDPGVYTIQTVSSYRDYSLLRSRYSEHCVTTLITAAKETIGIIAQFHKKNNTQEQANTGHNINLDHSEILASVKTDSTAR